jgi:CRISPR-associated protein Cmr4
MKDFRIGYLYSLAPIHCGGEGDLGNILEIAREVHTNFPYIPGSSIRGSIRDEVEILDKDAADLLFGKELDKEGQGQMGVHQVWFGDARLLWVPMRTMSLQGGGDVFTWVSCHSLIRDHAILAKLPFVSFPDHAVGTRAGTYMVADAQLNISKFSEEQKKAIKFLGDFPDSLKDSVKSTWESNHIVLPDADFQVLMEHSLWTQVRNKIQDETKGANSAGSAEVFWTDVCIPRDTILYLPWGYSLQKQNPVTKTHHQLLMDVMQGLIQVGGQANVGRGWGQSWVSNDTFESNTTQKQPELVSVGE